MKDFLRLYDTAILLPPEATAQNRLYFKDTVGPDTHLLVRIAASHAGRLTANNAFYPPVRMQAAIPTFTQPYQKPLLLNHNLEGDPLGRIIAARYVDTSTGLPKYQHLKDCLLQDNHQTAWRLIDLLGMDLLDPKFPGLGYAEVVARVTDREAIERILDGRYQTVSVAFVTDQAVCSICQTNWLQDGKCDHTPGQMVDDKPCFIVVGAMRFDEVSFVNRPADNLAGVLEFHVGGATNRMEVEPRAMPQVACAAFVAGPETLINVADAKSLNLFHFRPNFEEVLYLMSATTSAPQADAKVQEVLERLLSQIHDVSLEISSFADKEMIVQVHNFLHTEYDWHVENSDVTQLVPKDKLDLHAKLHQVAMEGGFMDAFVLGKLDLTLQERGVEAPEGFKDQQVPDQGDHNADTQPVTDQEELQLDSLFDEEKCWEAMDAELDAIAAELEDEDPAAAQAFRDAKLSAEQRKKLSSSTFCGPDRSFPVPDCAHVTAARRLINRYKGEGSKEAILRCVERKAKALGCDKTKKDAEPELPTKDELLAQRQQLLCQLDTLEAELLQRFKVEFSEPCQECLAKDNEITALKAAAAIDIHQLDVLEMDLRAVTDEVLVLREQLTQLLVQTIIDQRQLQAKKLFSDAERESLRAELSSRSLDSLLDSAKDQYVGVAQILEAFTTGMAHQPTEGQVADPTLAQDNQDQLVDADKALKSKIMQNFNVIQTLHGRAKAHAYLRDMAKLYPNLGISAQ